MKIYAENEDGSRVELKEIDLSGDGEIVVLQAKIMLREEEYLRIEKRLSRKLRRKAVIVPPYAEIKGVI